MRLCVDVRRPTLADRAQGKIPPGIYMRDIAIVLMGAAAARAYDFGYDGSLPDNTDHCLALIATERAICLELPSEYACKWFHERLELVSLDILTADEREERRQNQIIRSSMQLMSVLNSQQVEHARSFANLLKHGFKILHHHPVGRVYKSFLYADSDLKVLTVECEDRTFFGSHAAKILVRFYIVYICVAILLSYLQRTQLLDIVEVRPGTHSYGFVGTMSTDKHREVNPVLIVRNVVLFSTLLNAELVLDWFPVYNGHTVHQRNYPEPFCGTV